MTAERPTIAADPDAPRSRPGPIGFRIPPRSMAGLGWQDLDALWARAGELGAFDAAWLSDHLTDANRDRGGGVFESMTTAAALAHRVPGMWIGIAVLANTFRHPSMLAKAATVLDNATGGRFILGLGAGWHEGEHEEFGIPLPPIRERFDRFESAVRVLTSLFSDEARGEPGVTLDDPWYPLHRATNEPGAVRPQGPSLWIGGLRPRGIALSVRYGDGWPMPGLRSGDVDYFVEMHDTFLRALEAAGRDPATFQFAATLSCGSSAGDRRESLDTARRFARAGATHVTLGVPAAAGPDAVTAVAREVADPLREAMA